MKRYIPIFTALTLALALLAGCGGNATAEESTAAMETVANLFTTPTEPSQTEEATEAAKAPVVKGGTGSLGIGFTCDPGKGKEDIVYEGGELHVSFSIITEGSIGNDGIGLMLLLDGIPQPYRTADQEEYTYLHTFYPKKNGGTLDLDLVFTPVTGKAGDSLLLEVFDLLEPDYDPTVGTGGFRLTNACLNDKNRVVFQADPPETEMPAVTERVTEWTLEMKDLTSSDIGGWSAERLQTDYSFDSYAQAAGGSDMYFAVAEDAPLVYHAEVFSPSAAQWALVLYIDNQPVTVQPENIIQFSTPSGKKAVIDITLDMTGYRESAPIYAVLVARNQWDSSIRHVTSCQTEITSTLFLSREESLEVWLAKYHPA